MKCMCLENKIDVANCFAMYKFCELDLEWMLEVALEIKWMLQIALECITS